MPTHSIRLMIVDDHPVFRMGLVALLADQQDLKVVAECGNGSEAVSLYKRCLPDIVLMDLRLPGLGGVEATLAIRQEYPDARIIILTTYDTDEDIYRAIQSGAKSYLLKDMSKEEIVDTIRAVYSEREKLPPAIENRLAGRLQRPKLTQRESDVLQLLVRGRSNKEISSGLSISEDTVKSHLKSLFVKLGVQDRTAAAITGIRQGIVHL